MSARFHFSGTAAHNPGMTHNISTAAAARQQVARTASGQFGFQNLSEMAGGTNVLGASAPVTGESVEEAIPQERSALPLADFNAPARSAEFYRAVHPPLSLPADLRTSPMAKEDEAAVPPKSVPADRIAGFVVGLLGRRASR